MAVNKKGPPTNRVGLRFSVLAIIYGPALLFLAATVLAHLHWGTPFSHFSKDPAWLARMNPLIGIQSNMGVLVWWAGGAICLFCHLLLRRSGTLVASFFLWSSVLTFVLTLDDFFLFHEDLARRYLGLGQRTVYLVYVILTLWYLTKFRQIILNSNWSLLFVAFAFFGLSVFIDLFESRWPSTVLPWGLFFEDAFKLIDPWDNFFEDGFKLIGIVSWTGYLIQTCFQALRARMNAVPK